MHSLLLLRMIFTRVTCSMVLLGSTCFATWQPARRTGGHHTPFSLLSLSTYHWQHHSARIEHLLLPALQLHAVLLQGHCGQGAAAESAARRARHHHPASQRSSSSSSTSSRNQGTGAQRHQQAAHGAVNVATTMCTVHSLKKTREVGCQPKAPVAFTGEKHPAATGKEEYYTR